MEPKARQDSFAEQRERLARSWTALRAGYDRLTPRARLALGIGVIVFVLMALSMAGDGRGRVETDTFPAVDVGLPQDAFPPVNAGLPQVESLHLGPFATIRRANQEAAYYRGLGRNVSPPYHNGDGYYVDVR